MRPHAFNGQWEKSTEAIVNIREAIQLCLEVRAERAMVPDIETLELEIAA